MANCMETHTSPEFRSRRHSTLQNVNEYYENYKNGARRNSNEWWLIDVLVHIVCVFKATEIKWSEVSKTCRFSNRRENLCNVIQPQNEVISLMHLCANISQMIYLLKHGTASKTTWANDLMRVWGSRANADSNTKTGKNMWSIRCGSISASKVYTLTSSTSTESMPRAQPSTKMKTVNGRFVSFTKLRVSPKIRRAELRKKFWYPSRGKPKFTENCNNRNPRPQ